MSTLETVGREKGVFFTAVDLMETTFPEPRWAVDGLIAEGLNLLVGAPKIGKSWLALGLAVAVASGGAALGRVKVEAGDVLYAALEDTPRNLQGRLAAVLAGVRPPERLAVTTGLPRMPDALQLVGEWLAEHPDARLVIVDVLRKIRPPSTTTQNMYDSDYEVGSQLKALADKHSVALVVVHHSRKAESTGDVFEEVSGSTGLTGAVDATLYVKRARNTSEAVMHVTGRNIMEKAYGLTWNASTVTWSLTDEPAIIATMRGTRREIFRWIEENAGGTPTQIAEATGITIDTAKKTVRRMVEDGQLDTDGEGRYFVPLSLSPVSPVSPDGDSSDSGDSHSEGLHLVSGEDAS